MIEIPDYIVIDIETDNHNKPPHTPKEMCIGSNPASPFDPRNKIVCVASKRPNKPPVVEYKDGLSESAEGKLLVGQNIKFDLLHFMCNHARVSHIPVRDIIREVASLIIWDTMLAEYLLTGQQSMMASLDELALKYGGTVKDDEIKALWDQGYLTSDIPRSKLTPYAEDDGVNTEIVFLAQYKLAAEMGMLPLMESQMKALLATTVMEFNGMAFDKEKAVDAIVQGEHELKQMVPEVNVAMGFANANCMSSKQVGIWLFGGTLMDKVPAPVIGEDGTPVRYKSGMKKGLVKTKLTEIYTNVPAKFKCEDDWKTKTGKFKVDNDTVKAVINVALTNGDNETADALTKLLEVRKLSKDVSTYYTGYSNLTWPDGCIHPNVNHTSTGTGRLSCSAPNLQNVTSKE
jgi:DNA polymerase I-like protein with 3'-5' exonuclease and polymerase domains